jgi:two-component system response regulator FixJ
MTQPIHLIDDDPAILAATAGFLTAKGFGVKTYTSADGFLEAAGPQLSGCVVTDVRMPGTSGIELMAKMKERCLPLPVVLITAYADIPQAIEAMKQGAVDLLEKPFSNTALLQAVREALACCKRSAKDPDVNGVRTKLATLTNRENEVLDRLLNGVPNKLISAELGVSTRTIETHRATVMLKMKAGSIAELVKMVLAVPTN